MTHLRLHMLRLVPGFRREVIVAVLVGLAVMACYVAAAFLSAGVLASILEGESFGPSLASSALVLVALLRAGLIVLREATAQRAASAVKQAVRARVFEHLVALGPGYVLRRRTGEVQAMAVEGVESLEAYYSRYFPSMVVVIAGPVVILGVLLFLDPVAAAVILAAALFVDFGAALVGPQPREAQRGTVGRVGGTRRGLRGYVAGHHHDQALQQ